MPIRLRRGAELGRGGPLCHLPEALQPWVRRVTEDAATWFGDTEEEWPELAGAARRLKVELEELS
jgi:hypothetical protein